MLRLVDKVPKSQHVVGIESDSRAWTLWIGCKMPTRQARKTRRNTLSSREILTSECSHDKISIVVEKEEDLDSEESNLVSDVSVDRTKRTRRSLSNEKAVSKERIVIEDTESSEEEVSEEDFTSESSSEECEEDGDFSEETEVSNRRGKRKVVQEVEAKAPVKRKKGTVSRRTSRIGESKVERTTTAKSKPSQPNPGVSSNTKLEHCAGAAHKRIRTGGETTTRMANKASRSDAMTGRQPEPVALQQSTKPVWRRRMVPGLVRRTISTANKPLITSASHKRMVPGLSTAKFRPSA